MRIALAWVVLLFSACTSQAPSGSASASLAAVLVEKEDLTYELRFTNPVCAEYFYKEPLMSESGEVLRSKPKNVFCTMEDEAAVGARPESPQFKLIEWIRDPGTREIFFAFLSFSDPAIRDELCIAARERDVKIDFILDQKTDLTFAKELKKCSSQNIHYLLRGHSGGLGFAHNKIFMINPGTQDHLRFAFSSGNLSVGTTLHHENWNFLTVSADSYLAKAHLCVMNGMLKHGRSRADYAQFIQACRSQIEAPEEKDIRVFFAPVEGRRATRYLIKGIRIARSIDIAAHRFSYNKMREALEERMSGDLRPPMRLLLDDDIYWVGTTGERVGHNWRYEYRNARRLADRGAEIRYLQTNHYDGLLQHNKFIIVDERAVFTGAGNLTGAGFTENFENYYWIEIPEVVQAYRRQYEHLWKALATEEEDMPVKDVLPIVPRPPLYPKPKPGDKPEP